MKEQGSKQKITGMLNYYKEDFVNKDSQTGGVCVDFNVVADILIAAGFGFDTSHLKTFQTLDAKLRNAESRAERAERALQKFAETITCEDCPFFSDCASSEKMEDLIHSSYCFAEYLRQAEKELAEEGKDD